MDDITLYLVNYKKSKDKIWFEKIYYCFMPKIYKYFYYKTLDKQISEDLSSIVFFKIYNNLETKNFNSKSFTVWIYKVAKNQLIDHIRKTKKDLRNIPFSTQDDNLENILVENDFFLKNSILVKKEFSIENPKLSDALDELKPIQRDVLVLLFIMDFDYKTISKIFGKNESTIRGIIFRSLNYLRSKLKNE